YGRNRRTAWFCSRGNQSRSVRCGWFWGLGSWVSPPSLSALLSSNFVRHRPRINGQAVVVEHAVQLGDLLGSRVQLQQLEHLTIAVLFHQVDNIMVGKKRVHLAAERIGANSEVVRLNAVFLPQLIAGFGHGPVRRAVGNDACL